MLKYAYSFIFLGDRFIGVGICYVFVEKRIEEYIRAMFVILYAMPLAVIALLYVRISAEIKTKETVFISVHFAQNPELADNSNRFSRGNTSNVWFPTNQNQEHHLSSRLTILNSSVSSGVTSSTFSQQKVDCLFRQQLQSEYQRYCHGHRGEISRIHSCNRCANRVNVRSYNERSTQDSDEDMDIAKEKRTQNYLITMTTLFAVCWCPLHILILVNYFVHENEINMSHYDITYILFTWFGFLSTCSTPVLFASWFMSDATKDRLRGYFRFSNRRRSSASTQVCAYSSSSSG